MGSLVGEFGYRSTAESFSIADTDEVWLMEMVGTGPGGDGAAWVALRIPDGSISAYANGLRVREFPLDDPENCLYSDNVVSLAVEKGYYDPAGGKAFSFAGAYDKPTVQSRRYTATRVWSIFRRAAPSLELGTDYHRGLKGAEPYPLWIKPDRKLGVADVMALMRDHYESTPYDMTKGLDAGPYGTPNRWRPMSWEVDEKKYTWERPISTQQTGFSFVSQSRSWMPDAVGGVFWYGLDDTYTSCYVPLYAGIDRVPHSFTVGNIEKFSWDSAWWVFNFVANIANLKYSMMVAGHRGSAAGTRGQVPGDAAGCRTDRPRPRRTGPRTDASVPHAVFGRTGRGSGSPLEGARRVPPDQIQRRLCGGHGGRCRARLPRELVARGDPSPSRTVSARPDGSGRD